mmetsp:Transcript_15812/g.47502  ORF Transcript_15812/g.47502 Transcript_15812/m.47502 type:complete len:184 (-) Transcript_15812:97-648(-)
MRRCRLVWCHERCHKGLQCEARRQALALAAAEVGIALVCFKTAAKFDAWLLRRGPPPPFALLIGWREAKPCLQALEQHPARSWPVCTVVVAEETPQLERATDWAGALPAGSPRVMVFANFAEATAFALECMASARAGSPASPGRPSAASAVPGTEILSALRRGRSPAELADLLRSAMPERYDD